MLLYTLVRKEGSSFKLLGSTFESDVAIYLYYKNLKENNNIYFVWTKTEFHDFGELDEFNDFEIEFYVKQEDDYIKELLLEDKLNIYKLKSKYMTESKICSFSEEAEIEYSEIVEENEKRKEDILPEGYNYQDDEFFEHHYEAEVLYVGVLSYPIKQETKTIITGASYHEQTSAFLLQRAINELKPSWSHFYFKPIFIFKNQIKDYLNKNKEISFVTSSENVIENLALIALEKNEEVEENIYKCQYMNLTEVPEDDFETFMANDWSKFERDFNPNYYNQTEDLDKEDIISNYIADIRRYYLTDNSDWKDGLNTLKELCFKENITITVCNNYYEPVRFDSTNIESVFLFLKDSFNHLNEEDLEELSLYIVIRQETPMQREKGINFERVSAFYIWDSGIYNISKEDIEEQYTFDEDGQELPKNKNVSYLNSRQMFKILNLTDNLLDN